MSIVNEMINFPYWHHKVVNIAMMDKGWDYCHLGAIRVDKSQYFVPLVEARRNMMYFWYQRAIPIQFPPIVKSVDTKILEMNRPFNVGQGVNIGIFESFNAIRMVASYNGKYRVRRVEDFTLDIPTVSEFLSMSDYVEQHEIIKKELIAEFNL